MSTPDPKEFGHSEPTKTTVEQAESYIGTWFKSDHPWSFRSGRWGRILGVAEVRGRLCWQVAWEDEVCDTVVIDDEAAMPHYVFTNVPEIARPR